MWLEFSVKRSFGILSGAHIYKKNNVVSICLDNSTVPLFFQVLVRCCLVLKIVTAAKKFLFSVAEPFRD